MLFKLTSASLGWGIQLPWEDIIICENILGILYNDILQSLDIIHPNGLILLLWLETWYETWYMVD